MKKCSRCGEIKALTEFGVSKAKGHQAYCKLCQKAAKAEWRAENLARIKAVQLVARERNLDYIWNYLLGHPCVDCGEQDPVVLEFDHRDRATKLVAVSSMWFYSLEKLKQEIEKCDIRCANCHRRKTAIESGWWRSLR